MGSILHENAKRTLRVRKEIQSSVQSTAKNSKASGPSVLKWKKAGCVEDKRSGPAQPKHLYLQQKQKIVCKFRRVSKLSA
ncbi:hypothetical protein P618_200851 [Holospora obtusa F1]|uniref:Uncharacterized protein n=1 Tax=Holospora obtusa F1 TaxID=1399147 RepID=W6TD96_HOLOB|nr:hypothetical protein [Holospora obtusa]ETZ06953.1 hypothetical protein P618_200851 [Holospora obtusa F1]